MITSETIEKINKRFRDLVATPNDLPTQYDNIDKKVNKNGVWCRWSIRDGETFQISLGDIGERGLETVGIATAQLFAPMQTGEKAIRDIADKVCKAFLGLSDDGVDYDIPYVNKLRQGVSMASRNPSSGMICDYWQLNVICPFSVEEQG